MFRAFCERVGTQKAPVIALLNTRYNSPMTPLAPWQTFYAILGSAAGALVGLQFVAMALIADISTTPGEAETSQEEASAVFSTPTIVHLTCVLLLAAAMVMPWHTLTGITVVSVAIGLAGAGYVGGIAVRMGRQRAYKPVWEDYLYRLIFPNIAYLAIGTFGIATKTSHTPSAATHCLFGLATSALILLIMGIHNAWDNVIYIVAMKRRDASS
jgi:hypothetical protein